MNQPANTHYLLLLRHYGMMPTPAELEKIMAKFKVWMDHMKTRGELVTAAGFRCGPELTALPAERGLLEKRLAQCGRLSAMPTRR